MEPRRKQWLLAGLAIFMLLLCLGAVVYQSYPYRYPVLVDNTRQERTGRDGKQEQAKPRKDQRSKPAPSPPKPPNRGPSIVTRPVSSTFKSFLFGGDERASAATALRESLPYLLIIVLALSLTALLLYTPRPPPLPDTPSPLLAPPPEGIGRTLDTVLTVLLWPVRAVFSIGKWLCGGSFTGYMVVRLAPIAAIVYLQRDELWSNAPDRRYAYAALAAFYVFTYFVHSDASYLFDLGDTQIYYQGPIVSRFTLLGRLWWAVAAFFTTPLGVAHMATRAILAMAPALAVFEVMKGHNKSAAGFGAMILGAMITASKIYWSSRVF